MATNILLLPRSGNTNQFSVANNSDWLSSITLTSGSSPIDLTGIAFECNVRSEAGGVEIFLQASTASGTMVNGGAAGTVSFNVPAITMGALMADVYVFDILAIADGHTVNLYDDGPATLAVLEGVT